MRHPKMRRWVVRFHNGTYAGHSTWRGGVRLSDAKIYVRKGDAIKRTTLRSRDRKPLGVVVPVTCYLEEDEVIT